MRSLMLVLCATTTWAVTLPDATSRILVFSDQLNDAPGSANLQFNATHFVGMQKIDKARIDAYRAISDSFIVVQYHKSYGVDLGGNLTNAYPPYWNNDCDSFYAWTARNMQYGSRESYYIHTDGIADSAHRVGHNFAGSREYWLADPRHLGWKNYVAQETVRRCTDLGFDGTFFDVTYFPMYDYAPSNWYQQPPFSASSQTGWGSIWNNDFAKPYWNFIRTYYHSQGRNYLCIVNCDQMVTGWYEDTYLDSVDGAMAEGFFTFGGKLTGSDWQLSAGRILRYLTGSGRDKVLIAQCSPSETDLSQRRWCIANYLLLKNRHSYYNIAYSSNANWWPEYGIDIGSFIDQPMGLSDLLVAGSQSLYARRYSAGLVLVNPGTTTQTYSLAQSHRPLSFAGGGAVDDGVLPSMQLSEGSPVTGQVTVAQGEVLILRSGSASVGNPTTEWRTQGTPWVARLYGCDGRALSRPAPGVMIRADASGGVREIVLGK